MREKKNFEARPVPSGAEKKGGTCGGASLKEAYKDYFYIGTALPGSVFDEFEKYREVVTENFNSMTCENEMKPEFLLDRAATASCAANDRAAVKLNFSSAKKAADTAAALGMRVRLHTLVGHAQTPGWFFTEDYTDGGVPADRALMLGRMENYIRSVLEYYGENYPGLIYAVDVVNEAFDVGDGDEDGIRQKNSKWYETIGPDFVYYEFLYAKRYAPAGVSLFYNDYSCMWKTELILKNLARAKAEGLIDGIGMQSHLSVGDSVEKFLDAARAFSEAGYELQITELDVGIKSEEEREAQGEFYRELMRGLIRLKKSGVNLTSVTVWGLTDALSWRRRETPLLFDRDLSKKPAYRGFLEGAEAE